MFTDHAGAGLVLLRTVDGDARRHPGLTVHALGMVEAWKMFT
jgi:hypothetical protein